MFIQIITTLIFVSVIGCILYGRRLIKKEKVDAVFGNPERAKGGSHWVIFGSSAILLVWLYYSWDIAKGFYTKSAKLDQEELFILENILCYIIGRSHQYASRRICLGVHQERAWACTTASCRENVL